MKNLVTFLVRFRLAITGLLLLATLFFGYFITTIKIDNDTFNSIPNTLEAKIDYEKLKKEFPTNYTILFLAEFTSGTLSEKIDSLRSWSNDFKSLPGISNIADLNSVQIPVKGGFLVRSDFLVSRKDSLKEEQIRDRINKNREFAKLFISDDETVVGMVLNLQSMSERTAIFNSIYAKSALINQSPHIKTYMTSEGAVPYSITNIMRHDFSLLLPICFVLVFLLLFAIYRNLLHVVATLLVIVIALIWTFGIVGLLGIPFTVVLSIIPVIIFPIGVADAIHLLKTFSNQKVACKGDIIQALTFTYKELFKPCLLTSLTTFASFVSFAFSEISWTRYFGIFTGLAVLWAFVFNIIILPLFLSIDKSSSAQPAGRTVKKDWFDYIWDKLAYFTLESKKWAFILPVLIIVCAIGFQMVKADSNPISMLPADSEIRKSDQFISKHFGGTRFFSVMLENRDSTFTTSNQWKKVQQISDFIKTQKGVGGVSSIIPLITRLSNLLSNEPFSGAAISMLTSTKDFFGKGFSEYLKGFLSADRHLARLNVTCENSSDVNPLEIRAAIKNFVSENFKDCNVTISGPAVLTEAMGAILVETQISSLIFTFVPVFLCMVLFFRSIRIGIFSVIPILLATSLIYALMGVIGVTINSITVVTMNTCIGIGIDYAIHFISGYLYTYKKEDNRKTALRAVFKSKGTPILFNTIVVGIGFLVLAFSSFPPNRDFGILVFISMIISAFFSMVFLAVFIMKFGIVNNKLGKENV
ncbi:MAG TPA: MMPL family transporter [Chitinispirillaceae bacterium]|nr:MMPL family transporter [Chitinispirillaceae bacterium]